MKKVLLFISISFVYFISWANPCMMPQLFRISELYFDNSDKWFMELDLNTYVPDYDSIIISSSSGKSKSKEIVFANYRLAVITADSLLSNVNINPDGDSITICIYSKNFYLTDHLRDCLVFGDYRNAVIGKPKTGQSISYCDDELFFNCNGEILDYPKFNFDKSPTLGDLNDSTGMCGTLLGKIYNTDGQPMYLGSSSNFKLEYEFQTSSNGEYKTRVFARPNKIDSIWRVWPGYPAENSYYKFFVPIEFNMVPDSSVNIDFYLSESVYVGIQDIKTNNLIKLYPSVVNQNSILNYEFSLPVKSSNCSIEIIDAKGQLIQIYKIHNSKGIINLSEQLHQGILFVTFKVNNKVYKTSRIIIANK